MNSSKSELYLGRFEFISEYPGIAITCIVVLAIASLIGTIGNILILLVIVKTKELRQTQSIFIVNMALSDVYVTLVADTMSIVGKIFGITSQGGEGATFIQFLNDS